MFIVRCPAKINPFLAVGPADGRGWHPLRTVFQAIGIFDTLEIDFAEDDAFTSNVDWLPVQNSITRAVAAARSKFDLPRLRIHLDKQIPAESGLGGGSSDAAGVLRFVRHAFPGRLGDEELADIALGIGADVPFFLIGGRANAEGYGEILTPLPDIPPEHLLIVRPEVGCSTPEMYRRLDEIRYEWRAFPGSDEIYNDFLRVAPVACLKAAEELISSGATRAGLSGSGSAVFGSFPSAAKATMAAKTFTGDSARKCWTTRSITRDESLRIDNVKF